VVEAAAVDSSVAEKEAAVEPVEVPAAEGGAEGEAREAAAEDSSAAEKVVSVVAAAARREVAGSQNIPVPQPR
jgi:hypothetical protein